MNMNMNAWYWLAQIPGIGVRKQYGLLELFGEPQNIMMADEGSLERLDFLSKKDVEMISLYRRNSVKIEEEYQKMLQRGIRFIDWENEEYPEKLRLCYQPPIGIYCKGKMPDNMKKKVAIVGARMCTPYGKGLAKEIAKNIAILGGEVISGMARGIDGLSHEGALEGGGKTYAVLAGGVDKIYPPEHNGLYKKIIEEGGILSEYSPGTEPKKGMFPMRNRIISGICDAVILVEAREKSGSLITADFALEQGKDIFVVPGRISDPLSVGCNRYIKQGAEIITSIPDLIESLNLGCNQNEIKNEKILLEKEDALVYSCLRLVPQGLDELTNASGLGLMKVIEILSRLREMGLAEECYINQFIRSA